jgi:hypothetical protein
MMLNLALSLIWLLWWGMAFTEPTHAAAAFPIDPTNLLAYGLIGFATPLFACWFYRLRDPRHAPWPRPSFNERLRYQIRGPHPGWVFVIAWFVLLAGVGCAGFAQWREVPLSGFHALYLTLGVSMMVGALLALRVFAREFAPRA